MLHYKSINLSVSHYFKDVILRLKQRPYNLLLLTAILLFIVGLFCFNYEMVIGLYNSLYVIRLAYFIWIPTGILFIFWIVYLATKHILFSKPLIWAHIIFTMIGCFLMLTLPYFTTNVYAGLAGVPRRYYDIGLSKTFIIFGQLTKSGAFLLFISLIGQLTYLCNLFIGLYRRTSRQNNR
jgi:heme/copper-type cytochrome/quinol oxidase subunit 1